MRKYLHCLAIIGIMAACGYSDDAISDSASTASKNVMKTLEHIMAKAGISFDGEFRSQYEDALIGGSAVNPHRSNDEDVEYTSVDFDIKARPNTITQGHLIFRMEQDWRNFYSDISNPIFTRWISIDGSLKGMFSYDVGDFRQKYTPLTLYTPDIDILYEPEIFSKQREVAQQEVFLDDNQKLLQGVNMNFAAELYPVFNSLKVNLMGARLRSVQTNIQNGSKVSAAIDTSLMEKFMIGSNLDMTFLKGLSLGGNFINIFDNKGSYYNAQLTKGGDSTADTMAQNTKIADVRGGVDVGSLVSAKNWKLNVTAEMAMSYDDSSFFDAQKVLTAKTINGNALRAGVDAGYSLEDMFDVSLDAKFINNASNFRNELAQSPDFVGRRIMDLENDSVNTTFNVTSPLYSTFDAMYQQVFKFAPSEASGQVTNWWFKEPFSKNSYTNMVFTQAELSKMKYAYLSSKYLDPSLQLVMPFGPATPNRTGISGALNLGFLHDRVQAKVVFASLKEIDTTAIPATATSAAITLPRTSYSQAGGGIKISLDGFIGWKYPINLSSSVVSSKASNVGAAADTNYPAASVTSNYYCENLYFKFWKRAAFLAGMELINNQFTATHNNTENQLLTAIGLEYKVTDGSYIIGTLGQIDVTHTSDDPAKIGPSDPSLGDFNQKIVSLFLRVMF
jgi:hypothetical protein